MKYFYHHRYLIIICLIVTGCLILVYAYLFPPIFTPITSYQLENQAQSLQFQSNKPFNRGNINYIISPYLEGNLNVTPSLLTFTPTTSFARDQKYTFQIYYGPKLILDTEFIGPRDSSPQQPLIDNQADLLEKYPLIYQTPYETDAVRITYDQPRTLKIIAKQPNVEVIKIAQQFVQSNGLAPESHQYVIVQE